MMAEHTDRTGRLLERLRAGDAEARIALISHARARLRRLASRMLRRYPCVGRWEETDDVLQPALMRLYKALSEVTVACPLHFMRLARLQIARELIDLARRYSGPEGLGANHHTDGPDGVALGRQASAAPGPSTAAEWAEFYERAERLPAEERDVFGLIWHAGLTHEEAADCLGLSDRTVKRRWRSAKILLQRSLQGDEV